jgi:hypothetical protein
MSEFSIKAGYVARREPAYFIDHIPNVVFQPDVYTLAELLAELAGVSTIIDVGCGQAGKLLDLSVRHPEWSLVGIDYGPNLSACQKDRKLRDIAEWVEADLEEPLALDCPDAVVICSDVIEHLINPDPLALSLAASQARAVVFSTPERDVQHGYDHMGPSPNLCHIREWNAQEFHDYLASVGLNPRHVGLTRGSDMGWAMGTQVAVCTPNRGLSHESVQ